MRRARRRSDAPIRRPTSPRAALARAAGDHALALRFSAPAREVLRAARGEDHPRVRTAQARCSAPDAGIGAGVAAPWARAQSRL